MPLFTRTITSPARSRSSSRRSTTPLRGLVAGLAAALTAALVGAAAPAGAGPVPGVHDAPIEQLPFPVDTSNQAGWWRPLDMFGGVTYFAYNAPATTGSRHEVHVAARDAGGQWTAGCLRDDAGDCVTYPDDIGHNQPSIVVDGAGHIHAFVSMHNDPWRYYRTTMPGDVTSLVDASDEMPDAPMGITYPVTARGNDGDVYVMVRAARDSLAIRDGRLYRFDVGNQTWSREAVVASATNYSFYPNDLQVDTSGRIHLAWEWGPWPATALRHLGSYAVYDPADGSFRDVAGTPVNVPIRPDHGEPVVYQPFTGDETITSPYPAVQTAKIALDGSNPRLHGIAYRYRPEPTGSTFAGFDVRYATWDGSAWVRETVADRASAGTDAVQTSATIDATHAQGVTRIYFVAEAQACGGHRSQAVRAERGHGRAGWRFVPLGDAQRGLQRLRALTGTSGHDTVYLTAPMSDVHHGRVWHAAVPRTGRPPRGETFADITGRLLGDDSAGTNVALGAPVTVSSVLREGAEGENAVDGQCTDNSRWISAQDDPEPVITIDLEATYPVDQVRVYSGYHAAPIPATDVLRDFTIEFHRDGRWHQVADIAGNTSMSVVAETDGAAADQVRLVITDPSDSPIDVARVFEIEVISGG
ncbi:BNR-4 repeat-containing protein [Phytoactinopolyspora limicola]|uniref:BNR-4 repeat-containing protein n=1 Tax=Phytoactinopolyspora limicola TaxID=2715536 RepID=UPI00140D1ED1|nr:BNR-4 repeat-containing protein [Phytoactinopolyspora limicola]